MTTYTKTTDFAAKDALSTGNPSKLVKGTEIGTEFDNIATADATNAKKDSTNTFTAAQTISADLNVSGDVVLTGAGKGIYFEGTTADASESYLVAGEPTGDRTITLPDATTTLAGLAVAQTFTQDQTITGNLSISGDFTLTGAAKGIIFEGTTADANETTLVAGEPTADRTVTLPDESGTVALDGTSRTQTCWIPASAMTARTTSGAAAGTAETTTNKKMVKTLDFDASTDEFAQFDIRMPKSWDESTVTATFLWSNASGTGNVVWGLQGIALSDDDALDTAFGTAQTVTDGVTAAGDLMQSAATSAITIAGTPAAGDLVSFQVYRDADNGSDTLAVDARLHGVTLFYTINTLTDA